MADLRLLIVEDDWPSLELMAEVFSSLKAKVCPIGDSQQAAAIVDRQKFDGIFLDLEMPHIRGLELPEKVRSSSWNKSTPIIVVTGRDDRFAMQEAFETGATFFLQKPLYRQKLTGLFRTVRGTLFENRRRYTRVPVQTEVSCNGASGAVRCHSWNLSLGGIQVETTDLKAGEKVHLSFRLPGSTATVEAFGDVVWTDRDRRGIQFTKVSHQNEEEIREFIRRAETSD